jgi:acetylornithine deacetylase
MAKHIELEGNRKYQVDAMEQVAAFISRGRVQRLLSELVAIQSPSGSEGRLLRFVERYLEKFRVSAKRQYVSRSRYNLIASIGRGNGSGVLLNTHVDTVPLYASSPGQPFQRGKLLFGRGSCDAKGSIAAMVLAIVALRHTRQNPSTPVTLALTVGEENSGDGIERFIRDRRRFAFAIVGEPTDLKIAVTQSGYVELVVEARAKSCHAFDPIVGQPILAIARLIHQIDDHLSKMRGRPVHTFVRWIEGGERDTYWYTRPFCSASVLVNTFPDSRIRVTAKAVQRIISSDRRENRGVVLKVRVEDWDGGFRTSKRSLAVKQLAVALQSLGLTVETSHLPSWTDGSTLTRVGIPTIVFGPGRLRDAHTDQERVNIGDVRIAALAFGKILLSSRGTS